MRAALVLVTATLTAAWLAPESTAARLLPLSARPHGMTYLQWDIAWSTAQARRSLAADTSLVATDGTRCGLQRGRVRLLPVSLLGGTTFRCAVPRGSLLAFPVAGYVAWGLPPSKLRSRVRTGFERIRGVRLVVDGRRLQPGHVVATPAYVVGLPARNSLGAPPGPISMMSKDFFAILSPLSPGRHRISVRIRFGGASTTYTARYLLLVRGPRPRRGASSTVRTTPTAGCDYGRSRWPETTRRTSLPGARSETPASLATT